MVVLLETNDTTCEKKINPGYRRNARFLLKKSTKGAITRGRQGPARKRFSIGWLDVFFLTLELKNDASRHTPVSAYITIDSARIRFTTIDGRKNKPVLVYLHEGLGCVEMWKDFPQLLCSRSQCPGLLYDRQGFGQSSPLSRERDLNYVHDYARRELAKLIDKLLGDRPFILVGHSDGASIALIYGAADRPGLRGIISEAAHVFVEEKTIAGIRAADQEYERLGPKGLTKYHGKKTPAVFKGWSAVWLSTRFRSWNIEALLPAIHCPVLALQGADDGYGTMEQIASIVSHVSGTVEPAILANCGHTPHRQCPDTALPLMEHFINRIA